MLDRLLKDAFIIFGLTAYVYGVSLAFEFGYISYFGLPYDFVEVSFMSLSVGTILCVATMFISIPYILSLATPPTGTSRDDFMRYISGLFFLGFVLSVFVLSESSAVLYVGFIPSSVLALWPFIRDIIKSIRGDDAQPIIQVSFDDEVVKDADENAAQKRQIPDYYEIFWVTVSILLSSLLVGQIIAESKGTYMVMDDTDAVVLRAYGDRLIYARYDSTTGTVSNDFGVMRISEEPLEMTYEKIGPLQPSTQE